MERAGAEAAVRRRVSSWAGLRLQLCAAAVRGKGRPRRPTTRHVQAMHPPELTTLREAADWFETWLSTQALPVWSTAGVDRRNGSFHDALTLEGAAFPGPRRARVQARQAFVFATATSEGFGEEWLTV